MIRFVPRVPRLFHHTKSSLNVIVSSLPWGVVIVDVLHFEMYGWRKKSFGRVPTPNIFQVGVELTKDPQPFFCIFGFSL